MEHDFTISTLGPCKVASPISYSTTEGDSVANYVRDDDHIIYDIRLPSLDDKKPIKERGLLQKAGPRQHLYFNPSYVHAGIITCGGLCPGLNDVIRAITRCLWHRYNVRRITGFRYGFQGLLRDNTIPPIELTPQIVTDIHKIGGTILGSSRGGGEKTEEILDSIEQMNVNMLFTIGGDGTHKGALNIVQEIERRGLKIAVVGIPKTIDNDLLFVDQSFGFDTAVAMAVEAVHSARAEALSVRNGVGLVKVMGRESGFIAAHTAIASHEVGLVLIPEVPFALETEKGIFCYIEERLKERGNAVIIIAEGAGQNLFEKTNDLGVDASGNKKLGDIGILLRDLLIKNAHKRNIELNMKYIDPSYIIRSAVATPSDALYCARLGNNAVHAAMAGKTGTIISLTNNHFVHIPMKKTVGGRNYVDPESDIWRDVLEATHQRLSFTS